MDCFSWLGALALFVDHPTGDFQSIICMRSAEEVNRCVKLQPEYLFVHRVEIPTLIFTPN
jgi:hypothetical protein